MEIPNSQLATLNSTLRKRQIALGVLAVAALAFAVHVRSLSFEFTNWDDPKYVTENGLIRDISPRGLGRMFTSFDRELYIPLVWISYALDYRLWGLVPFGYHLQNVLLHVLVSCLVFAFLFRLSGEYWASTFAAALFAVHPLHVESVAWVTERRDVLSAVFFFLGALFYLKVLTTGSRAFYVLTLAAFILGLLSKPIAVTLPVVLALEEFYLSKRLSRRGLLRLVPLIALAAAFGALTLWMQYRRGGSGSERAGEVFQNLLIASKGLSFYLYKTVAPVALSAFYPHPGRVKFWESSTVASVAGSVAILAILLWSWKRNRVLAFGLAFFLVTILPVLRLVPVGFDFAADRNMYVPSVGLFFITAMAVMRIKSFQPAFAFILILAVLGALSTLSWKRSAVWQNGLELWKDVARKYPDSNLAHYNLADAFFREGYLSEAKEEYEKALALKPLHAQIHFSLANTLALMGRTDEAIEAYQKALELKSDYFDAHVNLGRLLFHAKRDSSRAIRHFELALKILPGSGEVWNDLSQAYLEVGKLQEAFDAHRKGLQVAGRNSPLLRVAFARALARSGKLAEAIEEVQLALSNLGPGAQREEALKLLEELTSETQGGD